MHCLFPSLLRQLSSLHRAHFIPSTDTGREPFSRHSAVTSWDLHLWPEPPGSAAEQEWGWSSCACGQAKGQFELNIALSVLEASHCHGKELGTNVWCEDFEEFYKHVYSLVTHFCVF